jgi:hypothetical protein
MRTDRSMPLMWTGPDSDTTPVTAGCTITAADRLAVPRATLQ